MLQVRHTRRRALFTIPEPLHTAHRYMVCVAWREASARLARRGSLIPGWGHSKPRDQRGNRDFGYPEGNHRMRSRSAAFPCSRHFTVLPRPRRGHGTRKPKPGMSRMTRVSLEREFMQKIAECLRANQTRRVPLSDLFPHLCTRSCSRPTTCFCASTSL